MLNPRFASGAAVILAGIALAAGRRGDRDHGRHLWFITLGGLGILVGAEAYLHYLTQTSLSAAWTTYAVALLALGFALRRRALRLAGLAGLGIVATKLVLLDLSGAPPLHRVLSFLSLGALMIVASYAYHRLERR